LQSEIFKVPFEAKFWEAFGEVTCVCVAITFSNFYSEMHIVIFEFFAVVVFLVNWLLI